MMSSQVMNKKSGKTGTVIETKEERILVQYSRSKIWGLAKNFEFMEPKQDINAPLHDEPDFSGSEPVVPKRELETDFSKSEQPDDPSKREPKQDIHAPLHDEPDFSGSEPVAPKRAMETDLSGSEPVTPKGEPESEVSEQTEDESEPPEMYIPFYTNEELYARLRDESEDDESDVSESESDVSESEQRLVWNINEADLKKFGRVGSKISEIFGNEDLDVDEAFFVLDFMKNMISQVTDSPIQTYDIETTLKLVGLSLCDLENL